MEGYGVLEFSISILGTSVVADGGLELWAHVKRRGVSKCVNWWDASSRSVSCCDVCVLRAAVTAGALPPYPSLRPILMLLGSRCSRRERA